MTLIDFLIGISLAVILLLPLIIKWELDKAITVPAMFFIGCLSTIIIYNIHLKSNLSEVEILIIQAALILLVAVILIAFRFYRDPVRKIPENENLIISPADGKIIYVKKINVNDEIIAVKNERKFFLNDLFDFKTFSKEVYVVGIAMTFLDVHINRAPIGGKVLLFQHIPGLFLSLKNKKACVENERAFTVIANNNFKIGILQITSRLVRNIKAYIKENNTVNKGDKIGMIRFGSQVDLIIPSTENIHMKIKVGDKVKAGLTTIAEFDYLDRLSEGE